MMRRLQVEGDGDESNAEQENSRHHATHLLFWSSRWWSVLGGDDGDDDGDDEGGV